MPVHDLPGARDALVRHRLLQRGGEWGCYPIEGRELRICDPQKQLEAAVANGRNLRELRFHTTWVSSCYGIEPVKIPFEVENARNLMLRDKSRIRVIGVGRALYTVRQHAVRV